MRTLLSILSVALLGFLLAQFLPWYSVAIAALAVLIIIPEQSVTKAFFVAFLGGLLFWGGYSGYLNIQNNHLLATRMGQMFGGMSSMTMVILTAVTGGIYAGTGAVAGYFTQKLLFKTRE